MDWLTNGQLTACKKYKERSERLQVQLAGCSVAANGGDLNLSADAYGWSPAFGDIVRLWNYTHGRIANLEKQIAHLCAENQKLTKVLTVKIGHSDLDRYVSQQQRIFDLEHRLKQYAQLEKQLHESQKRKMEGVTGAKMGLIPTTSKQNKNY